MSRPSLQQITVVLLLSMVGLVAVFASYRARSENDAASRPESRPAAPLVTPPVAVPELTPGPGNQLAKQQPPPLSAARTAERKPGLSFLVARVRRGRTVGLRSKPDGRVRAVVRSTTGYGSATTLSVVDRRGEWLGLTSSRLPNGKLGWVREGNPSLDIYATQASLRVDLSRRTLVLRNGRDVVRRAHVGIGRPGSVTPTGRFSITDALRGSAFGTYYGCCILALSGHQPDPPAGWQGGTRLAIHGTDNPRSIGFPSSAGCLRADGRDMRALMRRVPLGTPVFIRA
jgi:lipoprotein-anchoring transpeptidase ErfK/SrfK